MIGHALPYQSVLRAARVAAVTNATVLISGETGTGKELMAREIHQTSSRAGKPLIAVNCAALTESLAESQLFGHRKGAFTGAAENCQGLVTAANGGTLFMDELGELPLSIQAKLLRFMENSECLPVGSMVPQKVDVRIIAATNRDLAREVQTGRFRCDLFYRFNAINICLPPLRARGDDITHLLKHFTAEFAAEYRLPPPTYTEEAVEALRKFPWPGNIRQLRNFCQKNVIFNGGAIVSMRTVATELAAESTEPSPASLSLLLDSGIRLEEIEAQYIALALQKTNNNRSQAARLLGISRDTLLYRLKKRGVQAPAA